MVYIFYLIYSCIKCLTAMRYLSSRGRFNVNVELLPSFLQVILNFIFTENAINIT